MRAGQGERKGDAFQALQLRFVFSDSVLVHRLSAYCQGLLLDKQEVLLGLNCGFLNRGSQVRILPGVVKNAVFRWLLTS